MLPLSTCMSRFDWCDAILHAILLPTRSRWWWKAATEAGFVGTDGRPISEVASVKVADPKIHTSAARQ